MRSHIWLRMIRLAAGAGNRMAAWFVCRCVWTDVAGRAFEIHDGDRAYAHGRRPHDGRPSADSTLDSGALQRHLPGTVRGLRRNCVDRHSLDGREKNFAHVVTINQSWPLAYAEAAGSVGALIAPTFQLPIARLAATKPSRPPFFRPAWFPNIARVKLIRVAIGRISHIY